MKPKVLFTSEAVGEGHPDKICDQIADRVLDACLARDPLSRVACEVLAVGNKIVIAGEITCEPKISIDEIKDIARKTVRSIGYTTPESGISPDTMAIEVLIRPQSHDIAQGVDNSMDEKDIGAGDQGMMFGYATNETKNFMPLPYVMAQKIVRTAENLEKEGKLPHARPDMKSEVTIDYTNKNHPILNALVFSCQHDETIGENNVSIFREELKKNVLKPVVESFGLSLPEDDEMDIAYSLYNKPVLYGDPAPNYQLAYEMVYTLQPGDVFLVVGCSFHTGISVDLREVAKSRGARIIEIQEDAAHNVRKILEELLNNN